METWIWHVMRHDVRGRGQGESVFKLDGLVELVTRRVSEDFNGFLANASGYQNTQFQKLICPALITRQIDAAHT